MPAQDASAPHAADSPAGDDATAAQKRSQRAQTPVVSHWSVGPDAAVARTFAHLFSHIFPIFPDIASFSR